jgi:hypothetical protein
MVMKRTTEVRILTVAVVALWFAAILMLFVFKAPPLLRWFVVIAALACSLRIGYLRIQRRKEQLAMKNALIDELYKLRN